MGEIWNKFSEGGLNEPRRIESKEKGSLSQGLLK